MKYLQYLPNVTDSLNTALYNAPRPSILYLPNLQNLENGVSVDGNFTISNNIIYKNNVLDFWIRYSNIEFPDSGFTTTINGTSFKSYENNGILKLRNPQDLTIKMSIDDGFFTAATISGYTSILYLILDSFEAKILFPQSYYDYLKDNNLTQDDVISNVNNDTDGSFNESCLKHGFYIIYNTDNNPSMQFMVLNRGDISQEYNNINNSLNLVCMPSLFYNPITNKVTD